MPYEVKGQCLVYKHIRLDTDTIFYIGIGKNVKRPYSKNYRNNYWHNVVNKAGYKVEILFEDLTWDEAVMKECELIKKYGRLDNKTGILVNMTDGGDGVNGYKHTEEWKSANSIRNKNKVISEEQKAIIKNYMKNRVITNEFKTNVSKGVTRYYDEKGRKPKVIKHNKKDLIWVNKDNTNKRIYSGYLETYLNNEWVIGRYINPEISDKLSKKGSRWMNNGCEEAMISNNEINQHLILNWVYGRLKKETKCLIQ